MTVKTMAEVLAEHHMSRLNEGGWMCASFACSAKVNDMDDAMEHQAAALSAAGYGLVADAKREAWAEGFATGKSRAMRAMSDEPHLSLYAPNPYLPGGGQ